MLRPRSNSAPATFQDKGRWYSKDAFKTVIEPEKLTGEPDADGQPLFIDPFSIAAVNAGDFGNAFTGVVALTTRTIYLCPLAPASTDMTAYPAATVMIKTGVNAAPIVHAGLNTSDPNPSHLQLAKLVGIEGDSIGFTLLKEHTGISVYSFTSRSLNSSKFRERGAEGSIASAPLPRRPGVPGQSRNTLAHGSNPHGRMSRNYASQVVIAVKNTWPT